MTTPVIVDHAEEYVGPLTPGKEYIYGPKERIGIILGLSGPQVATIFGGLLVTVLVAARIHSKVAPFISLLLLVATGLATLVVDKTPTTAGYALRRALGIRRWRRTLTPVRHVRTLPPELGDVELLAVTVAGREVGVVRDGRHVIAVLRVHPRASTPLMDAAVLDELTDRHAQLRQQLGSRGSIVDRCQQLDITGRRDENALAAYYDTAGKPVSDLADRSYRALLDQVPPAAEAHTMLYAIRLDNVRARSRVAAAGGGVEGRARVVVDALGKLHGPLEAMRLRVSDPLDPEDLWAVFRTVVDDREPHRTARQRRGGHRPSTAAPLVMAREETWTSVRVDGGYLRTYWISEWPRVPRKADYLAHLVVSCQQPRAVTLVQSSADARASRRWAERAMNAHHSNRLLGAKMQRRRRSNEDRQERIAQARENEVSDGHVLDRTIGYVVVRGQTPAELDVACEEVEAAADAARLTLTVLSGQQAAGWTYALPLCRGLRSAPGAR